MFVSSHFTTATEPSCCFGCQGRRASSLDAVTSVSSWAERKATMNTNPTFQHTLCAPASPRAKLRNPRIAHRHLPKGTEMAEAVLPKLTRVDVITQLPADPTELLKFG